jgi:glycosyltransferase involved in cell wall biosynthesis
MGNQSSAVKLYNWIERKLTSQGYTINVSNDEARWARCILKTKPDQCATIPNSVDLCKYRPYTQHSRKTAKNNLGLPPSTVIIGAVGRLCYQKNPLLLIDSFEILSKIANDTHLLIVGEGELENEVHKRIQEKISPDRITKIKYSHQMTEIYGAIDIFASTSRYEGLPLVVLEALALNLPCVLSKSPGLSEFSNYGLSHLRYPEKNTPKAFADAVHESYLQLKNGLIPNHSKIASDIFCPIKNGDRVIEIYQKMVQQKKPNCKYLAGIKMF